MYQYKYIIAFLLAFVMSHDSIGANKYFNHWSLENGLPDNDVKSILHDSKGYLWIGTASGISKYDGYTFSPIFQDDTFIIEDIKSLKEDALGNIWINNYMIYDRSTGRFLSFEEYIGATLKNNHNSTARYLDNFGNLWIFYTDEVIVHKFNNGETLRYEYQFGPVRQVTDNGNMLALITHSGKLLKTVLKDVSFEEVFLPEYIRSEIEGRENGLHLNQDGDLWLHFNRNGALYCLDSNTEKWIDLQEFIKGDTRNNIVSAIEDINGSTWVSTDHNGIYVFDEEKELVDHIINQPQLNSLLMANDVGTLYRDNNGLMWIGYYRSGMSAFNPLSQRFTNHFNLKYGDVGAVMEDNEGNLWIGTNGNGVFKQNKNSKKEENIHIPGNICAWINKDSAGNVWVGTYLNGLLCFKNGILYKHYTQQNSGLANDYITQMQEDRFGDIWLASPYGTLQRLSPQSDNFKNYYITSDDDSRNQLNGLALHYDGGDDIYIGTYIGVYKIDITTGKGQTITTNAKGSQKIHGTSVQNLNIDNDGRLWIGTNQGLTIFDMQKDTLYYLNRNNGLCDNVIRGIFNDNFDNNWILTGNGLAIVKNGLDPSTPFVIRNYSGIDGLMNQNFNGRAFTILKNRNVIIGMENGYCEINPNKLATDSGPRSTPVLTGLKIGNITIDPNGPNSKDITSFPLEDATDIYLNYKDDYITLSFSQMDLVSAQKTKYAYKFDGLKDGWIYTSEPKITFTNLPYGSHTLYIKACNANGIWSDNVKELTFHIASPWWMTKWAKGLYVLFTLMLIIVIWSYLTSRNRKKLFRKQIEMERDKEQHINDMKVRFFTNISHDLRTPLTLISAPVQQMLKETTDEKTRNRLKLINRNAEQLLSLVNQILDYRKLDRGAEELNCTKDNLTAFVVESSSIFRDYAESHNISFDVKVPDGPVMVEMDFIKIRKVLVNLLSNAFKYTPTGGMVTLECYVSNDNKLILTVTDTGIGIPDQDKKQIFTRFYQSLQSNDKTGSGIGLHIVYEYIKLHNGKIEVFDNSPKGSIFRCEIPIIQLAELKKGTINDSLEKKTEKRPTILIIDDNPDFLEFMNEALEEEYNVINAQNGQEALNKLNDADIDVNLIVSDVMMPEMDGIELCKEIKTNINMSHIPIILLTARSTDAQKMEGLEYGADDYITKPFKIDLLKLRIQKFLEWSRKSHQIFRNNIKIEPSEITITSLDERLIQKAVSLIEEHIADSSYSVVSLSSDLGLTRGHLYKKLKFITGKSPLDFIHTIRVKRGRQLLDKSGMQVAEIAYAVGYNSPKIFSKYFKDEFGVTPSEYLKSSKQE